jgi:hypothetical protein
MEFWLSRSLSHELFFSHDGILAVKEPFTRTFFSRWNFGCQGAFHTNIFFFHDGILAIKEPFTRTFLFSRRNSGCQGAFHTNFFFFHDGILAVNEPLTRTFLFSRWNFGYQGAFHTNFSFFTMEFWLSRSLSHELFFFHDGITHFGGRLFSYIS